MRKLLALMMFIGLSIGALAQYPVTDNFPGASGAALSGNWTTIGFGGGTCVQDGAGHAINTQTCQAIYTGATFGNNQISRWTATDSGFNIALAGPVVRGNSTASSGYVWFLNQGIFMQNSPGSVGSGLTMTQNCPTVNVGDSVALAAVGSNLYCLDFTTAQFGTATDGTYTSGSPGIYFYGGPHPALGPFKADCYPTSCNAPVATPYTTLYPYFNIPDYYSPNSQAVTLTPTSGWTQCFTTDGSTPTATTPGTCSHGSTYSAPFTISATGITTVKTIATKAAQINSIEVDYTYNIGYQVPVLNGVQIFPATSIFNTMVNNLPVQATYNAAWQSNYATTDFFHDWYQAPVGGGYGGIPWNAATTSTPTFTPTFLVVDESDAGPYSILANTAIESEITPGCQNTTAAPGPDYHNLTVLNTGSNTGQLQEIYQASCTGGVWSGYSGAIWDLTSNALRPDTWTSADAAGLPVTPFLMKFSEAMQGVIQHPFRMTLPTTGDTHIWPARHNTSNGGVFPIGVRLRLKAAFNISGFSPINQVILTAFKNYGIFVADNGNNNYVQGATDPGWNEVDLDLLNQIPMGNFEAIDESSLMVNINSQQVFIPTPGGIISGTGHITGTGTYQ